MSWLQRLYETYEYCSARSKFTDPPQPDGQGAPPALMPISHTSQQAHILVVLDDGGNFIRAELAPKKQLVIPATEESAGRAGKKVAPHPLVDKVHYCAPDYDGEKVSSFKGAHDSYMALLKAWCDSDYSHPIIQSVLKYLKKERLVQDLVAKGFLHRNNDGSLSTSPPAELNDSIFKYISPHPKTKKFDQGDAIIYWKVVSNELEQESWNNKELQKLWRSFYASQMKNENICIVSSKQMLIAANHPRNIRRPGDGAKLISSNDNDGFTFRGRFCTASEACTVGYEVSQKAHNALRWLIARQGYRDGEQAIVTWAATGEDVPNPCENDFALIEEEDLSVDTSTPIAAIAPAEEDHVRDLGQNFSLRLGKAIAGYKAHLKETDRIALLALGAATPGRLSITFYRERFRDEYFKNLQAWQEDFAWVLPHNKNVPGDSGKKDKTVPAWRVCAPSPKEIAQAAYGGRIDSKLLEATIERLLPCVADAAQIPRDLVQLCVHRATNRAGLETWEWKRTLAVACALYKGYQARLPEKERRAYSMALDPTRITRDYLYGRLLAVAEYAERSALDKAGEKRPTNAERLMQRFADNPCATWRELEKQLNPYLMRLQSSDSTRWIYDRVKRVQQEICDAAGCIDNFISGEKLSGEFLLGYHCQYSDFFKKRQTENTSDDRKGDQP